MAPRLDIKRLEQHSLGIVKRGLMRDLGDNRRKQVWAAVLILESGAGRVLRTQASASEELSGDQDRCRQPVSLSLGIPSGLAEELPQGYPLGT